MALLTRDRSDGSLARETARVPDPAYQALLLLRIVFTVAPVLFGLDKFAHWLVDWDRYLAPEVVDALPGTAHELMYWLGAIIVNLLLQADYYDVALRDFWLLVGALTLARLAAAFDVNRARRSPRDV